MRSRFGKNTYRHIAAQAALVLAAALSLALAGCKDKDTSGATTGGGGGGNTTPASTSGGASGDEIVIGEYGSFTGEQADFGIQTDNGINWRSTKSMRRAAWTLAARR